MAWGYMLDIPQQNPLKYMASVGYIYNIMYIYIYIYIYICVTVRAKTRHVRTKTEIQFIAPAYSYTK